MQTGDFKGLSLITGSKTSEAWDSAEIWLFNASVLIEIIGFLKSPNCKHHLLSPIKSIDILHLLFQKRYSYFTRVLNILCSNKSCRAFLSGTGLASCKQDCSFLLISLQRYLAQEHPSDVFLLLLMPSKSFCQSKL